MGRFVDSKERSGGELFLFALGFGGFLIAATGLVVGSPGASVLGWVLLLLATGFFAGRSRE